MHNYGDSLFQGTAGYYARFRPRYSSSLLRFLVRSFSLDGTGRLLDLGCGPGELALRLSDWFEEVLGIDPEPEMLVEAARLSGEIRCENTSWIHGRAEDLGTDQGPFRLVTIASAFHWMDREKVLNILYGCVEKGGGVAIIDRRNPPSPTWRGAVQEVIKRWLGEERRAGDTTFRPPVVPYEVIASGSLFERVETHTLPAYEKVWTVDQILGHLYSTSFASRRLLGDRVEGFEVDLRETLLNLNPGGQFSEQLVDSVLVLRKEK